MNNEQLRKQRDNLYLRAIRETVNAMAHLLGLSVTDPVRAELKGKTFPVVRRVRQLAENMAYRDYAQLVDNQIAQVPLNRFTEELWSSSVDKVIGDTPYVTATVSEDIAMRGDYWARDAEWGERLQLAKQDDRIGRIARVDFEAPTCPLCTLMNSRGPVYTNESFLRTLHDGDTCTAIFVPQGAEDYPGKEHTEEALRRYTSAVKEIGPHLGANAVMAELKKQFPYEGTGVVRSAVQSEVASAVDKQIRQARRTKSVSNQVQPKTASSQKLRDGYASRSQQILDVLET